MAGFFAILEIINFLLLIAPTTIFVLSSFLNVNFSIFSSLKVIKLALMWVPSSISTSVIIFQYSSGLNDSISSSLSHINLKATDCTLPADFAPGSFLHKTGERLNPNK